MHRTREKRINFYLSQDEYTLLKKKALDTGCRSISEYIRCLIIYGFSYNIDYKDLQDYTYQLSRIGNNINQIAAVANGSNEVTQLQINELKEMMKKIWHTHESMLSKQPLINR